jgi:hypothetical protein
MTKRDKVKNAALSSTFFFDGAYTFRMDACEEDTFLYTDEVTDVSLTMAYDAVDMDKCKFFRIVEIAWD